MTAATAPTWISSPTGSRLGSPYNLKCQLLKTSPSDSSQVEMFPIGSVSLETPDQYKFRGSLELMFFCLSRSGWGWLKSAQTKKFKMCVIFGKIENLFAKSSFSYCGINLQIFHQPLFLLPWEAHPLSFFNEKFPWELSTSLFSILVLF